MVTWVMVGKIKEQYAGHIILADNTRLSLANGLSLEHVASEDLVTITYGLDRGGGMVVQSITRNAALRAYYTR